MQKLYAERALLARGWADNVELTIADGRIAEIAEGVSAGPQAERHACIIPAMPNLHSHAFQRAMAGFAEARGGGSDSFWSWRTIMYQMALQMTPEQMEAVAAQLYMEMLEAGFGRVGEFHYLHHAPDGQPYDNAAEMAERVCAAASETGISMTLLPVFYAHSGFGGAAPSEGQRRFIHSLGGFARLVEAARTLGRDMPGMRVGIAPHSLRAVTPEELDALVALSKDGPIHIHIAEQIREVEDCLAWSGSRPVQWLLAHADVDRRWCLIHATHLDDEEVQGLAKSGAVAGLCPITEANLGDGVFRATDFLAAGGSIGVGSDSNVSIGVSDELRMLEYSQRLTTRSRNVIARPHGSTGQCMFELAVSGGNQALSAGIAGLATGAAADLVSLDTADHSWLSSAALLDHVVFTGSPRPDCVWVSGRKQVSGGRHRLRDQIELRFANAMHALTAQL